MLPLSPDQKRLWFLDQWVSIKAAYNAPLVLSLNGPIDLSALRRALTEVVRRHEILRTHYQTDRGVPYQVIEPPPEEAAVVVRNLEEIPSDRRAEAIEQAIAEVVRRFFDLANGPVYRAELIRSSAEEHVLALCLHHIATDGWSNGILVKEMVQCYEAALRGRPHELPDLDVQYADYAVWQRMETTAESIAAKLGYWRSRLADLPTLDFPADHRRPAFPSHRGAALTHRLPESLRLEMQALCRREQVTLLTVLVACFGALLSRYTRQRDVVFGSIFSGRGRAEIEPLIGFFAKTLVLRCDTAGNPTFRELLARAQQAVLGAHLHQDVEFDRLVAELRPDRDAGNNPLFQICFTLQNATTDRLHADGLTITQRHVDVGTARFDLAVQVAEMPGHGLEVWVEYSTDLFEAERIRALIGHYARVLSCATSDPEIRLADVELFGPAQRAELLRRAKAPKTFDRADRLLHELFAERAALHPDEVACRFLGEKTTYGELNARADRLARVLAGPAHGIGPEGIVGVLLERGRDLPMSFLAVLKAGGAYLPLDPAHPAERIGFAVRAAGCALVLTSRRLMSLVPDGVAALVVEEPLGVFPERAPAGAMPGNAAYVIYTSGSTGVPKGVVVTHAQVVNFVLGIIDLFRLGTGDQVLQFANPAFDVSVFDFFSALCSGATLVQAPTETLHDINRLAELLRSETVTVCDLPPTVLGELDAAAFPDLRTLFVGLEPFPGDLVNRWNVPGREFHNGYGPTEATVACINYKCPDAPLKGAPPIGVPLPNYTAYVLDDTSHLTPDGVIGELYVGGAGVARGYLGSPGLTAEKFVPDPFGVPGGRLYRTGDLVSRDGRGVLTFRGRVDTQIKIRGLRIEPGEVEAAMTRHPAVRQALVMADKSRSPRLIAYVVTAPDASPEVSEIRAHLAERLPVSMIPAEFVVLDAFPLNANGKIERSRLPVPGAAPPEAQQPRTPTESRVAEIWAALLAAAEVGRHDDFFGLGGNSLKFAQVNNRLKEEFGVSVPLREMFINPTVAGLAELIEKLQMTSVGEERVMELLSEVEPRVPERSR